MGLLDQLKGELAQKLGGGSNVESLIDHAMDLINNQSTGGLAGLVETFKNAGLGDIIASWIGTGTNKPISATQLIQVLGSSKIQQMAKTVGASKEDLAQHLSQLLPQIIDNMTPNGKMPSSDLLGEGLNILKKNLFG